MWANDFIAHIDTKHSSFTNGYFDNLALTVLYCAMHILK